MSIIKQPIEQSHLSCTILWIGQLESDLEGECRPSGSNTARTYGKIIRITFVYGERLCDVFLTRCFKFKNMSDFFRLGVYHPPETHICCLRDYLDSMIMEISTCDHKAELLPPMKAINVTVVTKHTLARINDFILHLGEVISY